MVAGRCLFCGSPLLNHECTNTNCKAYGIAKKLIMLLLVLLLAGCGSMIDKLPKNATFDQFSYHRGGGISSASIVATGGAITDDGSMVIDKLDITEDWPMFNIKIHMEGYSAVQE